MPFAAAVSEHPSAADALGQVVGTVLEQLGDSPDLAVLFASEHHLGDFGRIAEGVRELLRPGTLVGGTAAAVIAGEHEIETRPALSLWAADGIGPAEPVHLTAAATGDGWEIAGLPDDDATDGARTLLLLADPFSFPADDFLAALGDEDPDLTVIGGLASAGRGPGGNRLVVDDRVVGQGAVGALLAPGSQPTVVVSQGCRPVGQPFVVTAAEQNLVHELGGKAPLERLRELVEDLSPDERDLVQSGLHVGRVIDENQPTFGAGDFLVRSVVGLDEDSGALAVGDLVPVGTTLQFQVRDADSADHELRELLRGRSAGGALLFTCNGRGRRLFDEPDHDASLVDAVVTTGATAGMFCAGELGPVGGTNFVHGFTASVALFDDTG